MLDKAGIDITPDQWLVLNQLCHGKSSSQREIAQKLAKDAASVNRMLVLLEKKGYISRLAADTARKSLKPRVTEEGMRVFESAGLALRMAAEAAMKDIKPRRFIKLGKTLREITRNLKQ
ncbi:MAG TPA: MarR family transcriptional regulator [Ignavibacteria bacterium]|nr:MarR family transcriptional regulator [Ignavibacteria bacterium]